MLLLNNLFLSLKTLGVIKEWIKRTIICTAWTLLVVSFLFSGINITDTIICITNTILACMLVISSNAITVFVLLMLVELVGAMRVKDIVLHTGYAVVTDAVKYVVTTVLVMLPLSLLLLQLVEEEDEQLGELNEDLVFVLEYMTGRILLVYIAIMTVSTYQTSWGRKIIMLNPVWIIVLLCLLLLLVLNHYMSRR